MKNLAIKCVFKRIFYRRDAVYRQYSPLYAAPVCREIICNGKMLCNTAPLYCRPGLQYCARSPLCPFCLAPPLRYFERAPPLPSFRLSERQRAHGEISKSCITFLLFWPCPSLLSFRPSEATASAWKNLKVMYSLPVILAVPLPPVISAALIPVCHFD